MTFCFVVIFSLSFHLFWFVCFFFRRISCDFTWFHVHFLCADMYQIAMNARERKKTQQIERRALISNELTHCVDPCDKKEHNTNRALYRLLLYFAVMNMWKQLCRCWDFSCLNISRFTRATAWLYELAAIVFFHALFCFMLSNLYSNVRSQSYSYHETVYIMQIGLNNCFGFFDHDDDWITSLETRKSI